MRQEWAPRKKSGSSVPRNLSVQGRTERDRARRVPGEASICVVKIFSKPVVCWFFS